MPFSVAGADQTVGQQARRWHAEPEHLSQAADRDLTLVAQHMHGAHLLHRDVEVAPLARGRGHQGAMKSPVTRQGVVD